ncbi:MAG: hypothetical protein D6781_06460, partial [Verrucomicrobia bacterium]
MLGNLKLKRTLSMLETEDMPLERIDAVFVEDAIVLLKSALERDGFLSPSGEARVFRNGEQVGAFAWSADGLPLLPRDLEGDAAVFHINKGRRSYFGTIAFEGLTALTPEEAEAFFVGRALLLDRTSARRFTPGGLKRGLASLQEKLKRLGYRDCSVEVLSRSHDPDTGRVDVRIGVREGRRYGVARVEVPDSLPEAVRAAVRAEAAAMAGEPWSAFREEQFSQAVRGLFYEAGYPKAVVAITEQARREAADRVEVTLGLSVDPGPRVRIGEVRFVGDESTRRSLLHRTSSLESGSWYRRSEVERTRSQIASLGVFASVRPRVVERSESVWDVEYDLVPSKRLEASVLAGYGSYERIRGGLELYHANLLGRAHRGRLEAIASSRSLSGEYNYTVPRVFGTAADATGQLYGLRREEVSFERREIGSSLGARRANLLWGLDATFRYKFERLTADVSDADQFSTATPTNSRVGALTLELFRDDRDNPISPHRGSAYGLTLETAARTIGGNVDYQKAEVRASWHRGVGRDNTLHVGLRHGVIFPFGRDGEVPLGRRFFPGGENTLRGYSEGKAAPRNEAGAFVGAEVSTILNVELDQALTSSLYVVAFVDAGLTAADIRDYPGGEFRVSAGVGVRYYTIIGP